jgi:hypothetical protein
VSATASYNSGTGIVTFGIPTGATGASGVSGVAGANGLFSSADATTSALASNDSLAILLAGAPSAPRYASAANLLLRDVPNTVGNVGFATTPHSYGTVTSGTVTVDLTKSIQATLTANGAFTLAPNSGLTGYQEILVTNGSAPGAITTSGWDDVLGSYASSASNLYNFICKHNTGRKVLVIEDLN